jgi:putative NADH-flavin reductase
MKLIIFGATGGTGKQLIEQALAAGHEVTAVARRPSAVTVQHERLHVVRGDVTEPATFKQAMTGQDAALSALGVTTRGPTTLYSAGIANIIRAMQGAGVRRLICFTATGLEPGPRLQRVIAKQVLWRVLKHSYTDLMRMEAEVKRSPVDWTIVRPPRLTNGPRSGKYQVVVNRHLNHGWRISRADLADYMLSQLDNRASYCATVEIAY